MPIVKAQCTNCGGTLEVDDLKEAAICPFCNTPYIVEKAITNYNTTNVVNIYGSADKEFEIVAGKLVKYTGASVDVIIPNNVTSIGEKAFYECTGLKSVIIPDSVTLICAFAFYGCFSLTTIDIPNSVSVIGEQAFRQCKNLTSIVFTDSVTEIRKQAFQECSALKNITIGSNLNIMGANAFADCTSLEIVNLPPPKMEILLNTCEKWARNTPWYIKYEIQKQDELKSKKKKKKIITIVSIWAFFLLFNIIRLSFFNNISTKNLDVFEYLLSSPTIKEANAKIGKYDDLYVYDWSSLANKYNIKFDKQYDRTYTYRLNVCGFNSELKAYQLTNYSSDYCESEDGKEIDWTCYFPYNSQPEKFEKTIIEYFNSKYGNYQKDYLSEHNDSNIYSWQYGSRKLFFVIERSGDYYLIIK